MSFAFLIVRLTLATGATGLLTSGSDLPKARAIQHVGNGAGSDVVSGRRIQDQILITVRMHETTLVRFRAIGVSWGRAQPKPGQPLDVAKAAKGGGSLSLLVQSSEAEKLQGWLETAVVATIVCVAAVTGDYYVGLGDVSILWIRVRTAARALVTFSYRTVLPVSGENAKAC